MNVDQVQKITEAIPVLEEHGYTEAAEVLKGVCLEEFRRQAEWLKQQ